MYKCAFCDNLFNSLDGLIPVEGSSLYFTADRKGIHQIRKVQDDGTEPEVLTVAPDLAEK